jgi:hypothetical protein
VFFTLSCDFRQRGSAVPGFQPSSAPKSQATSGGFQLFQAHIESVPGKRLETVLRIDPETDETWTLAAGDAPEWRRISDPDLNRRGQYNPATGKIEWEALRERRQLSARAFLAGRKREAPKRTAEVTAASVRLPPKPRRYKRRRTSAYPFRGTVLEPFPPPAGAS